MKWQQDDAFLKTMERSHHNEGGFTDDPQDRGNWTSGIIGVGELKGTKYGLSAMTYPDLDIKNITIDQSMEIYYRDWWCKIGANAMRPAVAYQFFDAAINHGAHNAAKMLQRACGAIDDGVIGSKTRAKLASVELNDLVMLFLAERTDFFTKISTFDEYGRGWMRRIANNLRYATEDN